jgi:hypothetical protein
VPKILKIESLEPNSTAEAKAFHVRPDGQAAMVVFGTDIPGDAAILWNGQPLQSSGGGNALFGVVPQSLYQTAGTAKISVRSGDTTSNSLDFTIYGKSGPAPQIVAISPDTAAAGQGFNLQPGGDSALGVVGTGFLPDCSVVVDGKNTKTVFGRDSFISAVIPKNLVAHTGKHQVWVANADSKTSNKVQLIVQ